MKKDFLYGYDEVYEKDTLRELHWFTKKRELLAGEEELTTITIFQLREIFNVTQPFYKSLEEPYDEAYDPYMTYVYDVNEEHAKALQPYVKHKIRLDKYDYSVAAYARTPQK